MAARKFCHEVVVCLVLLVVTVTHAGIIHKMIPQQGCAPKEANYPAVCCDGKNNTCRVFGPRLNSPNSSTCFCDVECNHLGDCCHDYQESCKPVDCELDEWAPYSSCDSKCGWGAKKRTKHVIVHPRNDGKPCGRIHERLPCYGYNCKTPRAHEGGLDELRETGKVIPLRYGDTRKEFDPRAGIRKNLFDHYSPDAIVDRPTYCATFRISNTRRACNSTYFAEWAPEMQRGARVCVECEAIAMKSKLGGRCHGHGVFHKQTRWNAITVPGCHGEWVMETRHEDCECDNKHLSFILI